MWILLAGLSALSTSLVDLTKKQANGKEIDFAVINFYSFFFAFLPACILVVAWGLPQIADNYWLVSTVHILVDFLAVTLLVRALKIEEISLVSAFISLSPIFVAITSPFILGEETSIFGFAGILLAVFGLYVLNLSKGQKNWLDPFRKITKSRGLIYAIIVSLLWSLGSQVFKLSQDYSSWYFHIWFHSLGLSFLFFLELLIKRKLNLLTYNFRTDSKLYLLSGLFFFGAITFHGFANMFGQVAYVLAIKRTNMLFSVFFGKIFFGEGELVSKFSGALIVLLGIVTIVLFG